MNGAATVEGLLAPYLNGFTLWGMTNQVYKTGSAVPAVGMATTYSVHLRAAEEAKPVFLQVQDGRISNAMALQPIIDSNVYDPEGRFLGRGGQPLEPMSPVSTVSKVDVLTAIKEAEVVSAPEPMPPELIREPTTPAPEPQQKSISELVEDLREIADGLPEPPPRVHRFHLRDDFEVELELPDDLTEEESRRLQRFISALPIVEKSDTL